MATYIRVRIKPPGRDWITQRAVVQESVSIESIIGQVVDTCDFEVHDIGATSFDPIRFVSLSDIRVELVLAGSEEGSKDPENDLHAQPIELLFGGILAHIVGEPEGVEVIWELSCQDYTILLDRSLVRQDYEANFTYTTDAGDQLVGDRALIAASFGRDVLGVGGASASSEINVTSDTVEQGLPSLSQQVFKYSTLREVCSQLAQYVGYDFYVDYGTLDEDDPPRLHYYYREDETAPYSLVSSPDSTLGPLEVEYRKASWKRDGTRVVNTFAVFGDRLVSEPQTFVMPSQGQLEYDLSYDTIRINFPLLAEPGQNTIRVDVNSGSNKSLTANTHNGIAGSSTLVNSSGDFVNDGVIVGDILINQTDGSWGVVTSVIGTQIVAGLREGNLNVWNIGDVAVVPIWRALRVSNNVITPAAAFDVAHDALGKTLEFVNAPPRSDFSIRLRFTYNFVGGQVDTDQESFSRYNRLFSRRVIASDVNSAAGMLRKLQHLKEQYAFPLEVVNITLDSHSYKPNQTERFRAGQWVSFSNDLLGVRDRDMLIHRVSTRIMGVSERILPVTITSAGATINNNPNNLSYTDFGIGPGDFVYDRVGNSQILLTPTLNNPSPTIPVTTGQNGLLTGTGTVVSNQVLLEYQIEMRDWEVDIL